MIRLEAPALSPFEAARRLAGLRGRFLLHSGCDADGCGRWSFASAEPVEVVSGRVDDGGCCALRHEGPLGTREWRGDPFTAIERLVRPASPGGPVDDDGPVPIAVGYLGFDLGRAIERLPARARARDTLTARDDLWFGGYGAAWRFDHACGRAEIVGTDLEHAERLLARLERPAPPARAPRTEALHDEEPSWRHLAAIERALAYIRAGDIYQVNLARRMCARVLEDGDTLSLLERVAELAPAPFGALLECDAVRVVSNSPEMFLRRAAGASRLETRPIKGTRRRGAEADEDRALAAELAADEKERAEHLMIVDLERNDLGRVADIGSVAVEGYGRVVSLPTVHHLVSTVSCHVREGVGPAAILRATFPGGSISGAPKVRALELIEELEPAPRGVYTGALGWIGAGGAIDLSIVIRTLVIAGESLTLHVGGGIVAGSQPERELEETNEKAAAWRAALESD